MSQGSMEHPAIMETSPLPLRSSPQSARTGPIKTGGRVFVLDHKRWPSPMKAAIDSLLNTYHGQKEMVKLVDKDYAAMVHQSASDPNSLLHPTTKNHITLYTKHLAKQLNTSSSLNTSPEKLMETQKLWQDLTEGSETVHVPVVVLPPATVNPVDVKCVPPEKPLAEDKQQQKPRQTKTCHACGQPVSRYQNDGSSVHHFYQQGPTRYHYCSTKVFQTYSAEGLTDPKMTFEAFAQTAFFQRELQLTRDRVEEKAAKRRKLMEPVAPQTQGRMCRFCHTTLKQSPHGKHIHTGFPGVADKYIYCPSKVFNMYKSGGMLTEMTWKEFQASPFYAMEKKNWAAERKK
ncbi:uncharacterized protein LOC131460006 [Solea solea]|uniref:uncharacterized protein LOC131460006 n=1 Tax=Solea solea TaxID=90069 RepID=UPI00272AAFC6|nr:uncharacterized protein LOC131460006 [Solea solea]